MLARLARLFEFLSGRVTRRHYSLAAMFQHVLEALEAWSEHLSGLSFYDLERNRRDRQELLSRGVSWQGTVTKGEVMAQRSVHSEGMQRFDNVTVTARPGERGYLGSRRSSPSMPRIIAFAVLLGMLARPALAASQDIEHCNGAADLKQQIDGCTQVIRLLSDAESLATAHMNRGVAYALGGQPERALIDFETAIRLDPQNAQAVYNRGNLLLDSGRFDHALVNYSRAIALQPDFGLAYLNRGLANEKLGRRAAAIADYRAALARDQTIAAARGGLRRLTGR